MDPKAYRSERAGKAVLTQAGFWVFIPNPLPPQLEWTLPLIATLSEAEQALSRLSTLIQVFPFAKLLWQPFTRYEAVISSQIEGTQASLSDVYAFETAQLSLFERLEDVREVHNYVRAMDLGMENLNTLPISLRLIRALHRSLMEGVRGGSLTPGEFRRSQNGIGPPWSTLLSAPFVPPPVEEMNQALDALEKFIHAEMDIPALIRIGLIHYQFEAIHPFLDGNGRVGRLLTSLLLFAWGLLAQPLLNLSVYFERHRQEYYDLLLGVSQQGVWEDWLRFFLRGIREQAQESLFKLEKLQGIRAKCQPIVEQERNSVRMAAIVDFVFTRPVFSARQLAEGLAIPFKTAQAYLEKLVSAGFLREITGFSRNRIYQADEILNAVQGLPQG